TPAFDISGSGLAVGPGRGIDGNQGADSAFDAVMLAGNANGGFTWMTANPRSTVGTLGYLVRRLRVDGPGTVTVPAGAVVKGTLELAGTTLDATSGGAAFTGTTDASAGLPCPSGFDP